VVVIRVVYPAMEDFKLMRIWDIAAGQALAVPNVCTKMMPPEWDASVQAVGGVEQDYIDSLGITEVQDMR
jgi:hypothetical protein